MNATDIHKHIQEHSAIGDFRFSGTDSIIFGDGKHSIGSDGTDFVIDPDLLDAGARLSVLGGMDLTLVDVAGTVNGINFTVTSDCDGSGCNVSAINGQTIYTGEGGAIGPVVRGISSKIIQSATNSNGAWLSGAAFIADYDRTTNFHGGDVAGFVVEPYLTTTDTGTGFQCETSQGLHIKDNTVCFFTGTAPTDIRGVFIERVSPLYGSGTPAVNAFGIEIANQPASRVSGDAAAIWLAGDGIGSDILFGAGKDDRIGHNGTDFDIATTGTIDFSTLVASAITTETLSEFITIKVGGVSKKLALVA